MVIHLAAVVGGIGANQASPERFFYDNLMMGVMFLEEARLASVKKFVNVGTICSHPNHTPVPCREEHLWDSYPEPTHTDGSVIWSLTNRISAVPGLKCGSNGF